MTINSIAATQMNTTMVRLSSGYRINSAADDAAGLAISEKMTGQIRGLDQGTRNLMDMQSLVNTAEAGLATINSSLLRIRELTVQATSGIMTQEDRALIQTEINQLMDEIDSVSSRTEFNTMRLLDGGFSAESGYGLHTSADAAGRGPTIHIGNMGVDMILGANARDYIDVVPDGFDMSEIFTRVDGALARVAAERSNLGAMSNRFDHTSSSNQIASLNLAGARSRIRDADMGLEMMRLHRERILEQARIMSQQREQEQEGVQMLSLLA